MAHQRVMFFQKGGRHACPIIDSLDRLSVLTPSEINTVESAP